MKNSNYEIMQASTKQVQNLLYYTPIVYPYNCRIQWKFIPQSKPNIIVDLHFDFGTVLTFSSTANVRDAASASDGYLNGFGDFIVDPNKLDGIEATFDIGSIPFKQKTLGQWNLGAEVLGSLQSAFQKLPTSLILFPWKGNFSKH